MMKPLLALVLSVVAVPGTATLAAQPPTRAAQSDSASSPNITQSSPTAVPRLRLRGTIESYDPLTRTLSLSTLSGMLRLPVAQSARVGRGAQRLEASDLRDLAGYRAAVRYSESAGSKTIESVNVFEKSERIVR
jgi:hypothetical protein